MLMIKKKNKATLPIGDKLCNTKKIKQVLDFANVLRTCNNEI